MLRLFAFLLLAAILLCPIAALAQIPTPFPASASEFKWHTIAFQYAKPGDVLKLMGIGGTSVTGSKSLPPGVALILVRQDTQSLQVDATDAGFLAFQDRLNTTLDIKPKQVRLKIVLASLPRSRQVDIDLFHPGQALAQMREAGAAFDTLPPVTVADGASVSLPVDWGPVNYLTEKGTGFKAVPTVSVQPRIDDDGSVFLGVGSALPSPSGIYYVPISTDDSLPKYRHSKIMAVYDATSNMSSASNRVLVFVTPTVIEPTVNHGEAITLRP